MEKPSILFGDGVNTLRPTRAELCGLHLIPDLPQQTTDCDTQNLERTLGYREGILGRAGVMVVCG